MQQIARQKEGRCLSAVYTNSSTPLVWQCSCGNVWKATPESVKSGRWCPSCGAKKGWTKRKRPTIKTLKTLARARSMRLLSSTYETAKTKYLWQCPNGHKFEATYSNVKCGKGCPYCHRFVKEEQCRFIFEQLTQQEFPRRRIDGFELDGYCEELKLAFEYQGEHHYKNTRWTKGEDGLRKQQQRDCQKLDYCNSVDITLLHIPYFEANSRSNLEKYIGDLVPVEYVAIQHIDWDSFVGKSNQLSTLRTLCRKRKIRCLETVYYNSSTQMRFFCEICNHIWSTVSSSVIFGTGCPKCATKRRTRKNTRYDKRRILSLRKEGKTFQEISKQVGCSISAAHYICKGENNA